MEAEDEVGRWAEARQSLKDLLIGMTFNLR